MITEQELLSEGMHHRPVVDPGHLNDAPRTRPFQSALTGRDSSDDTLSESPRMNPFCATCGPHGSLSYCQRAGVRSRGCRPFARANHLFEE